MLAQLAEHMRMRRRQQGGTGDEPIGEEGQGDEALVLDDDCSVSIRVF
jgi:hypothetical protein